jgi:Ca2+-binding RTX toxin-like protein
MKLGNARLSRANGSDCFFFNPLLGDYMSQRINRSSVPMFQPLEQRQLFTADLVVTAIVAQPQLLETNELAKAQIKVANQGDQFVLPGLDIRLVLSTDDVFGNADDYFLPKRTTNTVLGPGAIETIEFEGRASAQPSGQFRIGAFIDPLHEVAEGNEKNNVTFTAGNPITFFDDLQNTTIDGTLGKDRISFSQQNGKAIVNVNGRVFADEIANLTQLTVDAGAGDDRIVATPDFPIRLAITGAGGNDTIIGGAGNDELSGANGKDRVFGGAGNDYLLGSAGADRLFGEDGNDTLSGAGGNDYLYAGAGKNKLFAGAGNDRLFSSGNSNVDTLSGNAGVDSADADVTDIKAGIEG